MLRLQPELIPARQLRGRTPAQAWDAAVDGSCDVYSGRMHNICCDNCHDHVACALNDLKYANRGGYNSVVLAFWMFFRGENVSFARAVATFLPFLVVVAGVAAFSRLAL